MAEAFVQWNQNNAGSGSSLTITNAAHANVAGNLLLFVVAQQDTGSTPTSITGISDTANGAYTFAAAGTFASVPSITVSVYYRQNCAAAGTGTNTVTINWAGSVNFPELRFMEYSGVLTSGNPVHKTSTNNGSGSAVTQDSGNITTTVASCLLVGGNVCGNTSTGPGTNFAWVQAGITTGTDVDEYILNVGTGTYSAQIATTSAGDWASFIVAFLPSSGGGTQNATGSIGSSAGLSPTSRALRGANEPLASRATIIPTAKALHSANVII